MINILIPMSGRGQRFQDAGYLLPKPLIDVNSEPMIKKVIDNLNINGKYIFLVLKEHYDRFDLKNILPKICNNNPCEIITVEKVTEGAACTCLLAEKFINNNDQLIIANSDQFIENFDSSIFIGDAVSKNLDASILTFKTNNDPKWSYVKIDENDLVTEVAEKKAISDKATIGIYYWKNGSDYVKYAKEMIAANDRTNNEFYVVPAFNYAIKDNKKIGYFETKVENFWGLGTPEDLRYFLQKKTK